MALKVLWKWTKHAYKLRTAVEVAMVFRYKFRTSKLSCEKFSVHVLFNGQSHSLFNSFNQTSVHALGITPVVLLCRKIGLSLVAKERQIFSSGVQVHHTLEKQQTNAFLVVPPRLGTSRPEHHQSLHQTWCNACCHPARRECIWRRSDPLVVE